MNLGRQTQFLEHNPSVEDFRPVLFYVLSFVIAWTAWAPLLLHKLAVLQLVVPFAIALFVGQTVGAFAPLLSLFAIQRISKDSALISKVFSQLRLKGIPIYWYLLTALTPIVITIFINISYSIFTAIEFTVLRPEPLQQLGWGLLAVIPFQFILGMIGSPLGEEPGWRGYILDRFTRQGRALTGSVLVASLWWIWHLPLFLILDVNPNAYTFLAMLGHSLLIDSVFLLSRHNLLVAMLYHQGVNTSFIFLVSKTETLGGSAVLLLVAIVTRVVIHHIYKLSPN
jgi:membrane protease YdiL (CAAX protease family)